MTRHRPDVASQRSRPPTLRWERAAWAAGHTVVAGVDEAGRGAWAGPLVAAAVALPESGRERARLTRELNRLDALVHDSKLLSADQRDRAHAALCTLDIPRSICVIDVSEIDQLGLGAANREALRRAAAGLNPGHVLVDAFRLDDLPCGQQAIVHGDALCVSIALASIVAKVTRDRIMTELHTQLPQYGFAQHKGYGTRAHAAALAQHGVTPQHRSSFAPIARALADDAAG
jgi:ribonuclease HII